MGDRASAESWDRECGACGYRNGFIIPILQEFISRHAPSSILDVGAATGYIARNTVAARPDTSWTLLDDDPHRIELAKELCSGNFAFRVGNVFDIALATFDVILLSNTLLEFELSEDKFSKLAKLSNPSGWVVVILPDTFADVVAEARKGNDVFDAYARGNLRLEKEDKFTHAPYPFVAHRLVDVISGFVRQGLRLTEIKRNTEDGAFFLAFESGEQSR